MTLHTLPYVYVSGICILVILQGDLRSVTYSRVAFWPAIAQVRPNCLADIGARHARNVCTDW